MPAKKILIVDDEVGMLEAVEKKLTAAGYEVILATNGQEGMSRILEQHPDLILMDIMLPDIEGSEIVATLQNDPLARKIPIVFLSGMVANTGEGPRPRLKIGNWEYRALAKPFTYRELLEVIEEVFLL